MLFFVFWMPPKKSLGFTAGGNILSKAFFLSDANAVSKSMACIPECAAICSAKWFLFPELIETFKKLEDLTFSTRWDYFVISGRAECNWARPCRGKGGAGGGGGDGGGG